MLPALRGSFQVLSDDLLRVVVEKSGVMINNDEEFYHITRDELETVESFIEARGYKVMAVRPFYVQEIQAGFDPSNLPRVYSIEQFWDNPDIHPEITQALDAWYKLRKYLNVLMDSGVTPERAVMLAIRGHYYNCLSGGCSRWFLLACKEFLKELEVPLNTIVCGEDTVADFFEEVDGCFAAFTKH